MLNDIRADDFVRQHADAKRLQVEQDDSGNISIKGVHICYKWNGGDAGFYLSRSPLEALLGEVFMSDCDLAATARGMFNE